VLARADGGRLPVRRGLIDLSALLRDTVTTFAARASDAGVVLTTIADDGISAEVDGARLRQAIGNLVDNAVRHTPRGGAVRVELRRAAGGVAIEVADDGPGFDPAFVAHAFEPFSRADAARSRGPGGAGLGLAIVRAVAEAHGGSIRAANRPGGGASVVLELPASLT
jgi:signal transduction histidine kinase